MDENERMILKMNILMEQFEKLNIDARLAVIEEKAKRLESIVFSVMGIAAAAIITAFMALILK